eukprot:7152611-Prymnesium_polylepis.1
MGMIDSDDPPILPPLVRLERKRLSVQSPGPPLPPADRAGTRDHTRLKGTQGTQRTQPILTVQT